VLLNDAQLDRCCCHLPVLAEPNEQRNAMGQWVGPYMMWGWRNKLHSGNRERSDTYCARYTFSPLPMHPRLSVGGNGKVVTLLILRVGDVGCPDLPRAVRDILTAHATITRQNSRQRI